MLKRVCRNLAPIRLMDHTLRGKLAEEKAGLVELQAAVAERAKSPDDIKADIASLWPVAEREVAAAWKKQWLHLAPGEEVLKGARTHRFSLLLEGTFPDATAVSDTLRRFATAGYQTDVVVLAVRSERSRLDSMLRYTFTTDGQPGRFTPPTAHDTAYQRLPATIAAVEAVRELNRISVITRDGDEIFTNHRGPDAR